MFKFEFDSDFMIGLFCTVVICTLIYMGFSTVQNMYNVENEQIQQAVENGYSVSYDDRGRMIFTNKERDQHAN